ncbi:hypothetical protein LTR56_023318 [Elasticomyces elasticus]|nr:hypothetical protein LTR56_023318 [Elasticomyces elasticus]KAK3629843.1 hypothetical protein LTR22_021736 [Elasticomyces elasticus]KAK4908834.1 hypothetical protein LTR49_022338 [Elasticomyces elasticus]KAK5743909.1 hypothetical protein LTS12_023673 [Elasticomyces elasticus]
MDYSLFRFGELEDVSAPSALSTFPPRVQATEESVATSSASASAIRANGEEQEQEDTMATGNFGFGSGSSSDSMVDPGCESPSLDMREPLLIPCLVWMYGNSAVDTDYTFGGVTIPRNQFNNVHPENPGLDGSELAGHPASYRQFAGPSARPRYVPELLLPLQQPNEAPTVYHSDPASTETNAPIRQQILDSGREPYSQFTQSDNDETTLGWLNDEFFEKYLPDSNANAQAMSSAFSADMSSDMFVDGLASSGKDFPTPSGPVEGLQSKFKVQIKGHQATFASCAARLASLLHLPGAQNRQYEFRQEDPSPEDYIRRSGGTALLDQDGREVIHGVSVKGNLFFRSKHQNTEFDGVPDTNFASPLCLGGAVETLTYLPHLTKRPKFGLRLLRNGLTSADIALISLHALGYNSQTLIKKRAETVKHQMLSSGKHVSGNKDWTAENNSHDLPATTDYSLGGCVELPTKRKVLRRAPAPRLIDLARGVVNPPSPQDKWFLAQAIDYAVQHNDTSSTTDNIPAMAVLHNSRPASWRATVGASQCGQSRAQSCACGDGKDSPMDVGGVQVRDQRRVLRSTSNSVLIRMQRSASIARFC